MFCWKCRKKFEDSFRIHFRTVCPYCDIDLHVCKNCRYYSPGKSNDCMIFGTDSVRDRELANFCDEFAPLLKVDPPPSKGTKNEFDSLFKDP